MPPRRRRRGVELGLVLLVNELLQFGMKNIPPITLATILGQTLLYMGIFNVPWEKEEICISGNSIINEKDYRRLILSAIEHGDDMHLYFNMASFLIKGRYLERRYGSKNFAFILVFLTILTNVMYAVIAQVMTNIMETRYYMESCAIGFSGVIFALKVLTTHEEPYSRAMLLGIAIPGKYSAWVELLVIHMLVPNSSFMGHFAGILSGVIYCKTFLGTIFDTVISCITGSRVLHDRKCKHNSSRENQQFLGVPDTDCPENKALAFGHREPFDFFESDEDFDEELEERMMTEYPCWKARNHGI